MIPCKEAMARLWAYVDGELADADESEVRKHLAVCNRCYPQFNFQRAYFELLRRLDSGTDVPAGLRRRLFERILAEETGAGDEDGGSGRP